MSSLGVDRCVGFVFWGGGGVLCWFFWLFIVGVLGFRRCFVGSIEGRLVVVVLEKISLGFRRRF